MHTISLSLRHAIRQSRRVLARSFHAGRSPLALGALLLLGSTWTVIATANTAPQLSSLGVNATMIDEGQTITLTGTITDPDPGDAHTLQIEWGDEGPSDPKVQKVQLPPGQLSFTVQHRYTKDGVSKPFVTMADRQQPLHANENNADLGWGYDVATTPPVQVMNVAPSFVGPSITVTKAGGKSGAVVVEGTFTEPVDPVNVRATWGDAATPQQGKAAMACTVNQKAKTFKCEHTYKTSPAASYQIRLTADDGDGGEDVHTALVHIP